MKHFLIGFEKQAVIGPLVEAIGVGTPSALSYHFAKSEASKHHPDDNQGPGPLRKALGYALVPGYTGHRLGTSHGKEIARKRVAREQSKK
jgi:hypothetical protein